MTVPFQGRRIVADAITGWLRADLPPVLAELRVEWGVTVAELPDPALYLPHEPQALDKFPLIYVVVSGNPSRRRVEANGGLVAWQSEYTIDAYAWVRASGWNGAIAMQDCLGGALAHLMLDRPMMNRDGDMLLRDETFTAQFSDVRPVKGDRFVAGTLCSLSCTVEEGITRAPFSPVIATDLVMTRLPDHPALD